MILKKCYNLFAKNKRGVTTMSAFFAKIIAWFASLATLFGAIFSQPTIVPEYPEVNTQEKTVFD